jgi:D-tyrosyl-tRNA(Tyr) deacylase
MRAVVQRVSQSSVSVAGEIVAQIGRGLMVLLGVAREDDGPAADFLAEKIVHLRIFEDEAGKLNRSLADIGGEMLVVSQFTLLGDCRKGRRPSFVDAAPPDKALELYEQFVQQVGCRGISVATGRFRALMAVSLVNDGPVTLVLDTDRFSPTKSK